MSNDIDAKIFAELLKNHAIKDSRLKIGKFFLNCQKGVKDKIQYNQQDIDFLNNHHEYTCQILEGDLQVSLQLYENISGHYRLFCYTKINGKQGMTFSLNLTTEKESKRIIYLTQTLKFSEQYDGNKELAQAFRRQKQIIFCDFLRKLGYDITESNDVILGIFDPILKEFVNTSVEKFLNDFIVISIIKGHFQGNKGYQLEILPAFTYGRENIFIDESENKIDLPLKLVNKKAKRDIPLKFRYDVLKRDNYRCIACGLTSKDEDVILHIDHKLPFSLGGLTELCNLQTLCSDCNISKSNRHIDI